MIIVPSLLNSNIYDIQENVKIAKTVGDNYLHIDVMDGNFVPMQSFGGKIVTDLKKKTDLVLDVHLMINNPQRYIDDFIEAGADIITLHYESEKHLDRAIQYIKSKGVKAAVALNPATPTVVLKNIIGSLDMVLIMSVNPGFGGQSFIPRAVEKVKQAKLLLDSAGNNDAVIEVDGGINDITCVPIKRAGATVLVAGSAVFGAENRASMIDSIRNN